MGTEAHWDEGGGRTLPGDNTSDGAVILRPLSFQYAGVWISSELVCGVCVRVRTCALAYTTVDHVYPPFPLEQNSVCS